MSKIKYIKTRFTKIRYMMNNYTEDNLNIFQKIKVFFDLTYCIFRYGAGINDYFQYQFYKKKHYDRRKFIVHRKRMKIVKHFNTVEGKKMFDSKVDFNKKYKDLIGREWLDISTVKYEEFEQFVLKHQKFIVKPVDGSHGKGIRVLDFTKDELQLEDIFYDLKRENPIIEELIVQHDALAEFNPTSVNTLRVVTLNTSKGVKIMTANLRLGNGEKYADNFHHNGIASLLDVENGIVVTSGIDMNFNRYNLHPVTKKQIIGFNIPYWNEVVKTCKKAALITPEVGYVGWDVAIGKNGEIMIIEGNAAADPDISQIPDQIGKWPLYKPFI